MEIGMEGNFGVLISKQLRHTLDFVKRAAICNPKWPTLKSSIYDIIPDLVPENTLL